MSTTSADQRARGSRRLRRAPGRAGALHVITGTARRGAETFATDLVRSLAERGRPGKAVALTADDDANPLPVPVLGERPFGPGTLL
ncbi:MAG: hypothetical protein ACRDKS_18105, partial [Actinomycetota bacterium]